MRKENSFEKYYAKYGDKLLNIAQIRYLRTGQSKGTFYFLEKESLVGRKTDELQDFSDFADLMSFIEKHKIDPMRTGSNIYFELLSASYSSESLMNTKITAIIKPHVDYILDGLAGRLR